MNICSVIVHARPEQTAAVQSRLAGLPGVEVQGGDESGKFIVTVEDADGVSAADTMMSFNSVGHIYDWVRTKNSRCEYLFLERRGRNSIRKIWRRDRSKKWSYRNI